MEDIIKRAIENHQRGINFLHNNLSLIKGIANLFIDTLKKGGKIIFFGNGGSAADAQHLSAELLGRFKKDREALPSIALSTNTSLITALANDYSFAHIFSHQLKALAKDNDLVVGISTSGNSPNVIEGILAAKERAILTVGFLGRDGGKLKSIVDYPLVVPLESTAHIQEIHILVGHIICDIVENEIFKE